MPRKFKISLQEALEICKAHGLSISTPTPTTKAEILAESQELLKIKTPPKKLIKKKPETQNPSSLDLHLTFSHTIGSQTYGPGKVSIPWAERDLLPLLAQQDQVATRHQMETLTPRQPRCYMIIDTNGAMGARNTAIEVDETTFRAQNVIHSEINRGNVDHYASINRSILSSQGRIF